MTLQDKLRVAALALIALLGYAVLIWTFLNYQTKAQELPGAHQHPAEDAGIHHQFYSTWMRPDMPHVSCCNRQDCYPTAARFRDGHWEARRREDGAWLRVPEEKIERVRDNPDGRAHLCAHPPNTGMYRSGGDVICFISGSGV